MEVIFGYFLGNRENYETESDHPIIRLESNLVSLNTIFGLYRHAKLFGLNAKVIRRLYTVQSIMV
jgi:hypothetical protein